MALLSVIGLWVYRLNTSPTTPNTDAALGDIAMQQQRYPEAVSHYAAAAKALPDDGTVFLRLASAEMAANDSRAASAAAKRAVDLMPGSPDAVGLYGIIELKRKDNGTASVALRQALQMRSNDPAYLLPLVSLEITDNAFDDAERDLTGFLKKHPNNAQACYDMALIFQHRPHTPANLRMGQEYAQRAQSASPNSFDILNLRGQLAIDAGDMPQALRIYQAGLRISPNSEEMLHGLVVCYTRLGDAARASATAARLQMVSTRHTLMARLTDRIRLNQNDISAGLEMGRLEEEDGDPKMAEAFYRQVVRLAPDDPRTRSALAGFFRRTDRPTLAEQATRPDFVP